MSSGDSMGCQMRRALTSESLTHGLGVGADAPDVDVPLRLVLGDDLVGSTQRRKTSFSQMSSHHSMVTRSPNHW